MRRKNYILGSENIHGMKNYANSKSRNNWKEHNNLETINEVNNKFFLLRHGHSEANEQGVIISNILKGKHHYGLTPKGENEVVRNLKRLTNSFLFESDLVIISSPFLRTRETAQIAAEVLNANGIICMDQLRERYFGEFDQTDDNNYTKVWIEDERNPFHRKWKVESVIDVLERTTSLIVDIIEKYSQKKIILVTHCDVAMILLAASNNVNPKNHRQLDILSTGEIRELNV